MNYYYNQNGIGDTLLIDLLKTPAGDLRAERHGDVAVITDENGEVTGYNLFHASKYIEIEGHGKLRVDQAFVDRLTEVFKENGVEAELVHDPLPDFIIGLVVEKKKHPDADKLSVCQVDIGFETLTIVCGAPNVERGQKVVVARVGALMPNGLVIKDAELRGVPSHGMICSARELQLPNAPKEKGILVLDDDAPIGEDFWAYREQR